MKLSQDLITQLIAHARSAINPGLSPVSKYPVGAAVLTGDGSIVIGCNIETPSGRLACCAERVALFSALAKGKKKIIALALATPDGQTPCGTCRQVLLDMCGSIPILIAKNGSYETHELGDLLPNAYQRN